MAGATDPRLGKIDILLVSHMHGDHLGNAHNKAEAFIKAVKVPVYVPLSGITMEFISTGACAAGCSTN